MKTVAFDTETAVVRPACLAPRVYKVKPPCKPGYLHKWACAVPHACGVAFYYFDTRAEAEAFANKPPRPDTPANPSR